MDTNCAESLFIVVVMVAVLLAYIATPVELG